MKNKMPSYAPGNVTARMSKINRTTYGNKAKIKFK